MPKSVLTLASALALLTISAASSPAPSVEPPRPKEFTLPSEVVPEWALVAQIGSTYTVFVSPDGLKLSSYVAQVLGLVTKGVPPKAPVEVLVFDERRFTPRKLPVTDEQLLHLRARYRRALKVGDEQFVWVTVEDAKTRPPRLHETEAPVRPNPVE